MIARDRILQEAQDRGFGTGRSLLRTFINWQRKGLVGRAVARAPRRGGEGLWHERQLWIWLSLLHLRKQGAHLSVLANIPVACWMLGMDGVEIDQVQKVFVEFWGKPPGLPDLERSKVRRGQVDAAVDWMAVPEAPARARRQFRKTLAQASENLPHLGVSEEAYRAAAGAVLAPSGHPTEAQQLAIENAYGVMAIRALALSQLHQLTRHTPEVARFWEWGRRFFQATWQHYATVLQPTLAAQEGVGHLYTAPDLSGLGLLTEQGCLTQLTVLGAGLDMLRSKRFPPPGQESPPGLSWWPPQQNGRGAQAP